MVGASYRKYNDYDEFVTDFLFSVIENGCSAIIVNYQDYAGIVMSLNGKVLNGNSLTLFVESVDLFDEDIKKAMEGDGNIMLSVHSDGTIIGEPAYCEKVEGFGELTYFIEQDAAESAMKYPITSTIVPFLIEKKLTIRL